MIDGGGERRNLAHTLISAGQGFSQNVNMGLNCSMFAGYS